MNHCSMKSAEKTYMDAFNDELGAFIGRVKGRAKARIEEAAREVEEVSSCGGGQWVWSVGGRICTYNY